MSIPYPYISNNPQHVNSGSYFNKKETSLFVNGYFTDLWYGFSETDIIELSVFDLNNNQLGWKTIKTDKNYKKVSLSYINSLDEKVFYSYDELINDFILYKNEKVLTNPIDEISSSFGITDGSYILSYNFVREMAGDQINPLVIKDISPSRKEIKIIPSGNNNPRYEAFCKSKFLVKDVTPLLLQLTNKCPCDQLYTSIKFNYTNEIIFLKHLLFLDSDGALINFINNFYEDIIIYTNPANVNQPLEKIKRTQGIKTYFQNYLLSNYETIGDFSELQKTFNEFVSYRIKNQFKVYGNQTNSKEFIDAEKFLNDFFINYFFSPIIDNVKTSFNSKYYSYFKNALNFGNNDLKIILTHSFLDERKNDSDPLTLILKLKEELPDSIQLQSECWITNISLVPQLINTVIKNPTSEKLVTISPPNFSLGMSNSNKYNVNQDYSYGDLQVSNELLQTISINKKINELQVDYTDFSNFIIFSSAAQRLTNFKSKISKWYMLSSSLETLVYNASQSLSRNTYYPYYANERGNIEGQMADIVDSFDGYESYLFDSGSYEYIPSSGKFLSASYVSERDSDASDYDKSNRDSFINNTPQHIVLDSENDDYLTFLMMVGHFFDNIYLYISNLPSEKTISNNPSETFSKKVVDSMLESFGWTLDTLGEEGSTLDTYTTSISSSLSSDDRAKAIRIRILNTLPQLYKTKGTEESIKLLLSCYGIPSTLLSIREYGNNDYITSSVVTYRKIERACLFGFSGSYSMIDAFFTLKPSIRSSEFKFFASNPEKYTKFTKYSLNSSYNSYQISGSNTTASYKAWDIGIWREYGHMGRVYASLGSGSISLGQSQIFLTSSLLPIFDGEIFNVLLRRNNSDDAYEYNTDIQLIPTKYDLIVQRNESGRRVFKSLHSQLGQHPDNLIWDGITADSNLISIDNSHIYWGPISQSFYGAIGNAQIWDYPVSDADFEVHCNDFSSFAMSGSNMETHLIVRLDADEPTNFISYWSASIASGSLENKSEYYSTYVDRYADIIVSGSWTGSIQALYNIDPMPYSITYKNFQYYPLNATHSISSSCLYNTSSLYPYEYVIRNLDKIYTTQNYGPNRYKNEKVKVKQQTVATRLDDKDRSTYDNINGIPYDSNLLGLYLDPQDTKNRDIVKFFGNYDIIDYIADPGNLYSSSYSGIKSLRDEYNSFGNKKVLYNELITLYKIYFNKSIFDSVLNLLSARTNTRYGIVVEPTILERPKYQHRQIYSEVNTGSVESLEVAAAKYYADANTKLVRFFGSSDSSNGKLQLLYGEFNIDTSSVSNFNTASLPSNLTMPLNISYINEINFNYPINYNNGNLVDLLDEHQLGNFGSLNSNYIGQTSQQDLNKFFNPSGSQKYVLVKKWDKYTIYTKSGPYIRNSIRNDDEQISQSIWLYKLVTLTEDGYNNLFYTASKLEDSSSITAITSNDDVQYVGGTPYYFHRVNTAKNTPNFRATNIISTPNHVAFSHVIAGNPYIDISEKSYYEVFGGYPVNHYTHKMMQFTPYKINKISGKFENSSTQTFIRSSQTIDSTVNESGLEDGSLPVQSIETSNINLVKGDNVINQ